MSRRHKENVPKRDGGKAQAQADASKFARSATFERKVVQEKIGNGKAYQE